jgi:hypothetical protein
MMALPTAEHRPDAPRQHDTPGIGKQGDPPKIAPAEAAKPVLFDDIDPVLLVRLYPDAVNSGEARTLALAAGQAAYDEGAKLVAAQQEPVAVPGAEIPPPHHAAPPPPHDNKK